MPALIDSFLKVHVNRYGQSYLKLTVLFRNTHLCLGHHKAVMTKIWSNTVKKNSSRPLRVCLWLTLYKGGKCLMLQKSLPVMRHTKKEQKAQPTINVLKKNLFCHNLVHGVLSVWFCNTNKSRQVRSLFIF